MAEAWREAGGIRDFTPEERAIWRAYCAARAGLAPPAWAREAVAWVAEVADTRERRAMAQAEGRP